MPETHAINALYSRDILRHTASLGRLGHLDEPDGRADAVSRACGSRVQVDVRLQDGVIADYAQEVDACALGQCAASIVAREIVGTPIPEVRALRERMRALLKDGGPAPEGRFADLGLLEAVREYPARHASVLLVFNALCEAIDRAERGAVEAGNPGTP